MKAEHLEFLVEEYSMEAFLRELLPKVLGNKSSFDVHAFQGRPDLLARVGDRLRGYARWLPDTSRIIVIVDRDQSDCRGLKRLLEAAAAQAGMLTRSTCGGAPWRVANRIAIEELESWFFGEWAAVRAAHPRVAENVVNKAAYRHCDAIAGGTWEALERVLMKVGYYSGGLAKVQAAELIAEEFDPDRCVSPSFQVFYSAIVEATQDLADA